MSPPESKPVAREKLHHRSVVCQGFKRADGLWDIEAELVDTKTYSYHNRELREVSARIGRRESCTHLYELLRPLSTTAYQTLHRALEERAKQRAASNPTRQRARPKIIDQCYSLASDSAVVKLEWPAFYTGDDGKSKGESKDNAQ